MSRVLAVGPVLPGHGHRQEEITAVIGPLVTRDPARSAMLRRLHANSGVERRHLALGLDEYAGLSFGGANEAFARVGLDLAERACRAALMDAGVAASDVDLVVFTTVTGVSAPSLDALLVGRLGLRGDVRRVPSFGWGCAGGAAGLAFVHDHLVGRRADVALLVSVELCSLTIQRSDASTANLVSTGLFGDGASAVVVVGDDHHARRGPDAAGARSARIVDSRSRLYPATTTDLGWQVRDTGFGIMLSPGLPELIRAHLLGDVKALLAEHSLTVEAVPTWIVHAGGPRVLDAVGDSLGLAEGALRESRWSLRESGNLSSSSVLHVLARTLRATAAPPGSPAVLVAFGPGVAAELVLLRLDDEGDGR